MSELLIICFGLLAFGVYKKDFTALVFSGIAFILYGLLLFNSANVGFGAVSMGFGVYVALRAGIDLINYRKVNNG